MGWMHRNEARINPFLPASMPRLRWQVESDGWLLLGFDYVDGRHPDLSPGSSDLSSVAAALSEMAMTLTPCPAVKVQAATARWAGWIRPEVVDGDTLVHTDVTPFNFLIRQDGVTVVDWSMPCRGAAWIDTALMTIRLVRAGHRPEQAEANSDGRSICLYEFGEYLGGLLPVMDLTGPVIDFGSHHRQILRIRRDRDAFREVK
jgi:Ser/Thr protein kinase RdoA (MazF antagonist)